MWPFWLRLVAIAVDVVLWCVSFALWWNNQLAWCAAVVLVSFILGGFAWSGWKGPEDPLTYRRDDHFDA
jgi:hypothetical protein